MKALKPATIMLAVVSVTSGVGAVAQNVLGNSNPHGFVSTFLSPWTLFAANDRTSGTELWRLDARTGAVTQVADIHPAGGSFPGQITMHTGTGEWWFSAFEPSTGVELYRSGGNTVTPVANLRPGAASSFPEELTPVGSRMFFTADGGAGRRVWMHANGAAVVLGNGLYTDPEHLTPLGGGVVFAATSPTAGRELWFADGTVVRLLDGVPGPAGSHPRELVPFGARVLCAARDAAGVELWQTDGVTFSRLQDINPIGSSSPSRFLALGGSLAYFVADDGVHGPELWRTNGAAAGTVLVRDIDPAPRVGSSISDLVQVTAFGLLFVADDGVHGRELWKTDGTAAGTVMVTELVVGGGSAAPRSLTALRTGGRAVFSAERVAEGRELWSSDGSAAGTFVISDIRPGAESSSPGDMAAVTSLFAGGRVLFAAEDATTGIDLWQTDGLTAARLADIAPPGPIAGEQPELHAESTAPGGNLRFQLEDGTPFAPAFLALGLTPTSPVQLPFLVGPLLLNPLVVTLQVLDGAGRTTFTLAVPSSPPPVQFVAQGAYLANQLLFLSDLTAVTISATAIGQYGQAKIVGVFSDENHNYDVTMTLPAGMPDEGTFEICRLQRLESGEERSEHVEELDHEYDRDTDGLQLRIEGKVPFGKTDGIELKFRTSDGVVHPLWRSYC